MTEDEIEELALKSMANFGAPKELWIPHPKTGELVYVNLDSPNEEAFEVLYLLFGDKNGLRD